MNYIVRSRAWLDIEETMIYLKNHGDMETSLRFWQQTQNTFTFLTQQPEIGRQRPDLKPAGLRSWRVNGFEKWLVFYRIGSSEIEIFRVKHAMMDLPRVFEIE